MAIRVGQSKKKREPISEINVTPFVDVMLVLLVIFMITAPLLTTGIKINLPESSAKVISEKKEPVTVTIKRNGDIFLQKKKINQKELVKKLFELKKLNEDLKIYIRGDKDLNYGQVIRLMGTINKAGFKKVALVTKLQ